MFRHDELKDGVAQELQALVIEIAPMRFVAKTRMSERLREEKRITKLVADAFFQRVHWSES